jgi:class 3 adenylate cyclase
MGQSGEENGILPEVDELRRLVLLQRAQLDVAEEYQEAAAHVLRLIREHPGSPEPVFQSIVKTASRLCEAENAIIFKRQRDVYLPVATESLNPEFEKYLWESPTPANRGSMAGRAGIERAIVHVPDALADPEYQRSEGQRIGNYRSMLGVPLLEKGNAIAVIVLLRAAAEPYTDAQIRLVETFADQAVIAIENARLFEEAKEQARALAELNKSLEERVTSQVKQLARMGRLKQFLSPAIVDALVSSGEEALLSSHRSLIATLFCDIRGFTSFCETAEPEETIEVLQAYHEEMGRLISAHGGGVDKRMGDGIMVIFNDPLPCEDPAGDAVRLAVAMRSRMAELSKRWRRLGHRLGFGVGISLGYATIGMVGSEGRYDYTASGTAVNLAARLCDRADDGEILLSPRAHTAIEDSFEAESNGELSLKGIRDPVEVFKLISL